MGLRLIDAEKLEKFIEDGLNNPDKNKRFGHDAIEIMTEVHFSETVDAVPVVRCKDCKYYNRNLGEEKKTCIYLAFTTHALEEECRVGEDDFCSRAEKKA